MGKVKLCEGAACLLGLLSILTWSWTRTSSAMLVMAMAACAMATVFEERTERRRTMPLRLLRKVRKKQ